MRRPTRKPLNPWRLLSWRWLFATAMLACAASVPLFHVYAPSILRWRLARALASDDDARRQTALSVLARHGDREPELAGRALAMLGTASDARLIELQGALRDAGLWRRPTVDDGAWLRWLGLVAGDPDPLARREVPRELVEAPDLAGDERVLAMLEALLRDPDADTRYAALVTVAELVSRAQATGGDKLIELIARATGDESVPIARTAWVYLGLIRPARMPEPSWRHKPPEVAQAVIWASLRARPGEPAPAVEALRDHGAPSTVRAMAAYALHQSPAEAAREALIAVIDRAPGDMDDAALPVVWRALLAVPLGEGAGSPGRAAVRGFLSRCAPSDLDDPLREPLILAACHRCPEALEDPGFRATHRQWADLGERPLLELALLEGLPEGSRETYVPQHPSDLIWVQAGRVLKHPTPGLFRPALSSGTSMMRDLAALTAARRFPREQAEALAGDLLKDFVEDGRRGGAMLAGLAGVRPKARYTLENPPREVDLLEHVAGVNDHRTQVATRLALWLQGRLQAIDPHLTPEVFLNRIEALLAQDDYDLRSTILMALLRKEPRRALDFLLNPRGQERIELVELFDQYRWWPVLRAHLPEEAPPFWVWSDPALARFQVDVLREWYLLNRARHWPG